jgi:hypothetical protein
MEPNNPVPRSSNIFSTLFATIVFLVLWVVFWFLAFWALRLSDVMSPPFLSPETTRMISEATSPAIAVFFSYKLTLSWFKEASPQVLFWIFAVLVGGFFIVLPIGVISYVLMTDPSVIGDANWSEQVTNYISAILSIYICWEMKKMMVIERLGEVREVVQ